MNFGRQGSVSPDRLQYLAQPKKEYEPADIYKHQEFRGLLHADHQEAVVTVLSNKKSTSFNNRYSTQGGFSNLRQTTQDLNSLMKTPRDVTYMSDLPKITTHESSTGGQVVQVLNNEVADLRQSIDTKNFE